MFENADDVGRQASVRLAAEVGDIHRDTTTRLELAHAFGEDVGEHLEVLEVGGGDALALQLLFVLLAGEVGRRRDHECHRSIGDAVHVACIAVDERLGDR